ncbi:YraN family protein [Propionimicrobium sp. PCR01-08-3]|uniref:YraN family protein n=1 Tax=Propionimicrobium sp. PCR01-08-3 TaxID=3052086 RepID=UPI00255CA84A|nr:YraN family protein [Propionimicrobium sp. PCR01-08-3]WIY81526.1 YraN family protein [Propionimicrobium sp. PCR01-08-3]
MGTSDLASEPNAEREVRTIHGAEYPAGKDIRRALGNWGEQLAAEYLIALGWKIIARNWRCPVGEADLICLEPAAERLPIGVVVEVKCRSGRGFGDPLEAITYAKQKKLRQLAVAWRKAEIAALSDLRVDAVGILKLPGAAPLIRHVRGAA